MKSDSDQFNPAKIIPVQIIRAKWIATFEKNVGMIQDGAVAFSSGTGGRSSPTAAISAKIGGRGRPPSNSILAVGDCRTLQNAYPAAPVLDNSQCVVMPGLINAHCHTELSSVDRAPLPDGGFGPWLLQLVRRAASTPEQVTAMTRQGIARAIEQCARFGVTTVGDITRFPALTRPLLADAPLRTISFGEIQALAKRRNLLDERLAAATDARWNSDRLSIGISPHAPYTVEPDAYRKCLETAQRLSIPLATHLAESPDEKTFLADHAGPFRELWEAIGQWDNQVPTFARGPIQLAADLGLLSSPTLLAHVNYCDDEELALLAKGRASVVYCPRTHEYFQHPPHRFVEMIRAGINVAVGTDSCASSPDLNVVDDLRLAYRLSKQSGHHLHSQTIWEMIMTNAARALGLQDQIGSITPGKSADFAVFEVSNTDDPLREILETSEIPIVRVISV